MHRYLMYLTMIAVAGCQQPADDAATTTTADTSAETVAQSVGPSLDDVLAAQSDEIKARYAQRHPKETLDFIGIEPGMTVVEGLPGGGWYSKILARYLGSEGRLIGADYPMEIWPLLPFGTAEFIAERAVWAKKFRADALGWAGDNGAAVDAFVLGSLPEPMHGTADVVFFARVLHNLARFQKAGEGPFLDNALADAFNVLKPGGVFGVVQHEARASMSDEFADGNRGYLKKAWVIEQVENAGFEFVAESGVNENPLDVPGADDIVWRLPPSYRLAGDDPEKRAAVDAIGESNRMTLKFRKPE